MDTVRQVEVGLDPCHDPGAADVSVRSYLRPESLEEASRLLAEEDGAKAISGGTDLGVAMRHGVADPRVIVDLKSVPDLASSITRVDGGFRIAANTVMTDLETSEEVRHHLPGLVEAAEVVGSVQIRNRATLAGNLTNASPAADTPPVLVAMRAAVELFGPSGTRVIDVDEFLVGYRETALQPGELITAVIIPSVDDKSSSAFMKLGVRRAMEISIVCVGASIALDDSGAISAAGVGLGSVAPTTVRSAGAEEVLVGNQPSDELFARAGQAAAVDCSPIDDLRASGEYRHEMVPILVRRSVARAYQRASETT